MKRLLVLVSLLVAATTFAKPLSPQQEYQKLRADLVTVGDDHEAAVMQLQATQARCDAELEAWITAQNAGDTNALEVAIKEARSIVSEQIRLKGAMDLMGTIYTSLAVRCGQKASAAGEHCDPARLPKLSNPFNEPAAKEREEMFRTRVNGIGTEGVDALAACAVGNLMP